MIGEDVPDVSNTALLLPRYPVRKTSTLAKVASWGMVKLITRLAPCLAREMICTGEGGPCCGAFNPCTYVPPVVPLREAREMRPSSQLSIGLKTISFIVCYSKDRNHIARWERPQLSSQTLVVCSRLSDLLGYLSVLDTNDWYIRLSMESH